MIGLWRGLLPPALVAAALLWPLGTAGQEPETPPPPKVSQEAQEGVAGEIDVRREVPEAVRERLEKAAEEQAEKTGKQVQEPGPAAADVTVGRPVVIGSTGLVDRVRAYEAAKARTTEAEKLHAQGDTASAIGLLEASLPDCEVGAAGASCRQLLTYSKGYLLEEAAARDPSSARDILGGAARAYEQALAEAPAHGPTLNNLALVYQRLGDDDRSERLLRQAIDLDPYRAGDYSLQLGDLYLKGRDPEAARESYRIAAELSPRAETPRRRLVETYEATGDSEAVLELGRSWRESFPGVAKLCFETAIRQSHEEEPARAEEALLEWVTLLVRRGRISLRDLASLPAGWDPAALADLASYMEAPHELPSHASWWRGDERRATLLAAVGQALGRAELRRKRPGEAERIWTAGLELLPPFADTVLPTLGDVRLDLYTQLATLYFTHPELDPEGERFAEVEDRLFEGKAQAYRSEDLEAVQRFHTVLGLIYSERGVWTSSWPYRNAEFQLSRAIRTAERRRRATGFYEPLPRLHERLADGYLEVLEDHSSAGRHYLAAAAGYLDTDSLRRAARVLERARELLAEDAEKRRERAELARIARLRRALAEAAASEEGLGRDHGLEILAALAPREASPLAEPFRRRQSFKAAVDAAAHWWQRKVAPEATLAWAAAERLRLEDRPVELVGTGDLLRLEALLGIVAEPLGCSVAVEAEAAEPKGVAVLTLHLPGEEAARFARLDPDSGLAARITESLGSRAVLALDLRLGRAGDGTALVHAPAGIDPAALSEKIGKGPPVTVVAGGESL